MQNLKEIKDLAIEAAVEAGKYADVSVTVVEANQAFLDKIGNN